MKLLLSAREISDCLMSLMDFKEYCWAVAWAGQPNRLFDRLKQREGRIKQLVVGTHFHQTSPVFIQEFRSHSQVRFIVQPSGVFHPKIYLFRSSSQWAAIVGSANFTDAAFTNNQEAAILLSSTQGDSLSEFKRLLRLVDQYWHQAQPISGEELERYKVLHKRWKEAARTFGSPSSGRSQRRPSNP
jgi:HKD family nuclease